MYMAVASPSVSGLVAMMTSRTPPALTRSSSSRIRMSSGPMWLRGEMTPCSTWYTPAYSRARSMATTSLASATTQITPWSRSSSSQMAHLSRSVRFWQMGQVWTWALASRIALAKLSASSWDRERV